MESDPRNIPASLERWLAQTHKQHANNDKYTVPIVYVVVSARKFFLSYYRISRAAPFNLFDLFFAVDPK